MTAPDHPFVAVHRMARGARRHDLRLVVTGLVIRRRRDAPTVVARPDTDPSRAADRRRVDHPNNAPPAPFKAAAPQAAIGRHFAPGPGASPAGGAE
jgi:hypothetical protein